MPHRGIASSRIGRHDEFFFQSYEVTIEVIDVLNNESFEVQEKERDGRAKHILAASTLNVTCILNTLTAEGYLVEGELR